MNAAVRYLTTLSPLYREEGGGRKRREGRKGEEKDFSKKKRRRKERIEGNPLVVSGARLPASHREGKIIKSGVDWPSIAQGRHTAPELILTSRIGLRYPVGVDTRIRTCWLTIRCLCSHVEIGHRWRR